MKYQALFSSKDKIKKLKCRLLQFLFGALRVKIHLQAWYTFKGSKISIKILESAHVSNNIIFDWDRDINGKYKYNAADDITYIFTPY